jgi:hypothetical protein
MTATSHDMAQRVADILGLVGHQRAQGLNELELVGQQLVGGYAVRTVYGGYGQADDLAIAELEPSISPDDDYVTIAHRYRGRESGVVGAHDLLGTSGGHADQRAHTPSLADEGLLRVGDVDYPRPARAAAVAADQAEPSLGSLEHKDVRRWMAD